MEIRYIPTYEPLADLFTKSLGTTRFPYLKYRLKVVDASLRLCFKGESSLFCQTSDCPY